MAGVYGNSAGVIVDGLPKVAPLPMTVAPIVVEVGILREQRNSLREILYRCLVMTSTIPANAAVVERVGIIGLEFESLCVIGDGQIEEGKLVASETAIKVCLEVIGVEFDR